VTAVVPVPDAQSSQLFVSAETHEREWVERCQAIE